MRTNWQSLMVAIAMSAGLASAPLALAQNAPAAPKGGAEAPKASESKPPESAPGQAKSSSQPKSSGQSSSAGESKSAGQGNSAGQGKASSESKSSQGKSAERRESTRETRENARESARDTRENARDTRESTRETRENARESARETRESTRESARDSQNREEPSREKQSREDRSERGTARDESRSERPMRSERSESREERGTAEQRESRSSSESRTSETRENQRSTASRESSNSSQKFDAKNVKVDDLGLSVQESGERGLTVSNISRSGVFADVGFQRNDRIIAVNDQRITRQADFVRYLFVDYVDERRVPVTVLRGDVEEIVYVQPAVLIREYETIVVSDRDPIRNFGVVLDDTERERLFVARVIDDSPADRAGIRRDDEILAVNERVVESRDDLARIIEKFNDETLQVEVRRERQPRVIEVELLR